MVLDQPKQVLFAARVLDWVKQEPYADWLIEWLEQALYTDHIWYPVCEASLVMHAVCPRSSSRDWMMGLRWLYL